MFQLELNLHNLDREIEALRAAVADKINPTKLVETRLEMRNRRPVLELVQVITTVIYASQYNKMLSAD